MNTSSPVPVAPLDYEIAGTSSGAAEFVRRLGIVCVALGLAWAAASLYGTVRFGFSPSLRGGFAPLTFVLALLLVVGGAFSIRPAPEATGRRLIEIFAIGTLANLLLVRLWDLVAGNVGFPSGLFSFFSLAAYTASFPMTLLIVLRMQAVRNVYR